MTADWASELVYFLCAATSVFAATLLLRAYRRTRVRLLLWSSSCFAALAVTNSLLFVNLAFWPDLDLSPYRAAVSLFGLLLLLYGLITES